jgi:UDP-3-O-[3-hydroxymyristoyl] glucosamine N-acyltransferase
LLLGQLAQNIDGTLIGDSDCKIDGIAALQDDCKNKLSFVLEKKYIAEAANSAALAFITFQKIDTIKNQIVVKNPRKALAQVINLIYKPNLKSFTAQAVNRKNFFTPTNTIIVDSSASIGENTTIEEHSEIMANVSIGANCKIGKNCIVYPGVIIYDNTEIGDNVILQAGAKVGVDGFGYYFDNNKFHKIPHIGKVVIGNDVEIGANTCIDRGCLGATSIGNGTKIDNLTHIAHNTKIGEHTAITGLVAFMGGASVGNNVHIGGQAGIANVNVGNNVVIAAKSGVTKDIKDNSFVSGFPAWDHQKELRKESFIRRLFLKDKKIDKGRRI